YRASSLLVRAWVLDSSTLAQGAHFISGLESTTSVVNTPSGAPGREGAWGTVADPMTDAETPSDAGEPAAVLTDADAPGHAPAAAGRRKARRKRSQRREITEWVLVIA